MDLSTPSLLCTLLDLQPQEALLRAAGSILCIWSLPFIQLCATLVQCVDQVRAAGFVVIVFLQARLDRALGKTYPLVFPGPGNGYSGIHSQRGDSKVDPSAGLHRGSWADRQFRVSNILKRKGQHLPTYHVSNATKGEVVGEARDRGGRLIRLRSMRSVPVFSRPANEGKGHNADQINEVITASLNKSGV